MAGDAHFGPGDVNPRSGIYRATSHEKADIALSKGDRFPPLEEQGARWVLFQATEQTVGELAPDARAAIEAEAAAAYDSAMAALLQAARDITALGPNGPDGRRIRAHRDLRHALQAYDTLVEGMEVTTTASVEEDLAAEPNPPTAADYTDGELQDLHDREHELAVDRPDQEPGANQDAGGIPAEPPTGWRRLFAPRDDEDGGHSER